MKNFRRFPPTQKQTSTKLLRSFSLHPLLMRVGPLILACFGSLSKVFGFCFSAFSFRSHPIGPARGSERSKLMNTTTRVHGSAAPFIHFAKIPLHHNTESVLRCGSRRSVVLFEVGMSEVWKVECTKEKKRNSSFLIFYGHVPLLLAFVECFLFVFLLKGLKRHFPPSAEGFAIFLRSLRLPCVHGDLIFNGKLRRTPLKIRIQAGFPFATSLFKAISWILRIMSCKLGWKLMTKFALRCSVYERQ